MSTTITAGTECKLKIGRATTNVTVIEPTATGGWSVRTDTGKTMTIKDASRLTPIAAPPSAKTRKAATATPVADTSSTPSGGRVKGQMSGLDAAVTILRERENTPMNTADLVAAARDAGYWAPEGKTPAATLYSAILREITTKGDEARFVKTARGKFALRD